MAQITLNSTGVASDGALVLQSNGTTTAVTITTAQNVGIGTASPSVPFDVQANSSAQGIRVRGRASGDSSSVAFYSNNNATEQLSIFSSSSENAFFGTGSRPMTFSTNNAERMQIDSSGNVGIGTSSPSAKLHVVGDALANTFKLIANTTVSGSDATIFRPADNTLAFSTNGAERARIDSSGNLLVGTTTSTGRVAVQVAANGDPGVYFRNQSGTNVGQIQVSSASTVYVTSSDYRLKENVTSMTGALSAVAALKPCTYTWKESGEASQGFIAHELAEVCPDAVVGEKDAVDEEGNIKPQGIDTSFLVATLTAAIQEQQALITTLTDRITALEAK
jgi:hypothetical protein